MENQFENQNENQFEKNLINQNEKNYCLRIFKEQIDLINELPEGEREKVLYIAVVNAFQTIDKENKKSSLNQFENQNENAYISVSVSVSEYISSIYKSLHNISKSVLNLLLKTLEVKEFSSNYGGKRSNSGRKKTEIKSGSTKIEVIPLTDNYEPFSETDYLTNPNIDKVFEVYKKECPDLLKLSFEPRNAKTREEINTFLKEIDSDIGYFTELCKKANKLKYIVNKKIDFKSLIKNHIGINNGKYEDDNRALTPEEIKELINGT